MIIIMEPHVTQESPEFHSLLKYLERFPHLQIKVIENKGVTRTLLEVHLIGEDYMVSQEDIESLPGVEKAIKVTAKYRLIGRHGVLTDFGFTYKDLNFSQDSFHIFAGLCAVDTYENAEAIFKALKENGVCCARMGAYKPRTSPYDFQGLGKECLPWLFDLAGKYGIKVIVMEVLSPHHIDEIREALDLTGHPCGVILQIGTRNAQNFELLKAVGRQLDFPVLYKRGYGLSLEESLNAAEYIASEGNTNIIFCLRGVRTHLGDPHRNLVDFAHVPVVKRLTRLPVCIDPSHPIGSRIKAPDGIRDIYHITAQGVIAGANAILVEFHPCPEKALCDGPQALPLDELPLYLEYVYKVRETYLELKKLVNQKGV
ncbi:3-deoxy-7-phosphoheptulonate synthase [Thermodesulfobacterium sp.]|uniref:3-deoxy-7-phosphoheptulonate synthase n=1 Tax=Thermodesulfobacterium sp. TaxID=1965289 RepID=UPI00264A3D63|nr:3-deoxy-7-phosphoheptulonate synthase [Thermodesulfobacterium sp.]MDN5380012.1 3-deoxy-7-phosphoheptulonate synthase [Thermodesulfobacterium sp.]